MIDLPKHGDSRVAPDGLEYLAMLVNAAFDALRVRDLVTATAAGIIMLHAADWAAGGPLHEDRQPELVETTDPVLVAVGSTPIRLSDAQAQAVISPSSSEIALDQPAALFEAGLVDEAADQTALATAAAEEGLDQALEIRAQLALARRRILSSAYLDRAVRQQVTEEAIIAAYHDEVMAAASDQVVELRRIQLSSQLEALDIAARISAGETSFPDMARRQSLDMTTRSLGGKIGALRFSELPSSVQDAIHFLRVGEVSAPVEGEQGWYLLMVDSRHSLKMPPFAEMKPHLEQRLRDEVVEATIDKARAVAPITMAHETAQSPAVLAITAAATAWQHFKSA